MCSSGLKCPWSESCPVKGSTPSATATVVPTEKVASSGIFEKVIKSVSQSGGSAVSNVSTNPTGEMFHTGTPTFKINKKILVI